MKITYQDYKGVPQKEILEMMKKYDFSTSIFMRIWSVLNIPKKKKDQYRKFEKVYFSPAFERTTSFIITYHTVQIAMQNFYLDICEICAKWARQELTSFQDSTKAMVHLQLCI